MSKVNKFALNFMRSEDGPRVVEYAVILVLIIVVFIAAFRALGFNAPATSSWAASSLATALGLVLLLPVYAIGGMGAGDVKMQMGFGSWVGAFFGLWAGLGVVWWAFAVAVVIGGFLALGMIALRRQYRHNLANTREIVGD